MAFKVKGGVGGTPPIKEVEESLQLPRSQLVLIIEIMDNPQSSSKYILPSYPTTFQLLCFFKFTL